MLIFKAGTPLEAVFRNVRLPKTPLYRHNTPTATKVFRPTETPAACRLPVNMIYHPNIFSLLVRSSQEHLQPIFGSPTPPTLSPVAVAALTVLDACLGREISNEKEVDNFMTTILESVAYIVEDLTGAETELFYELPTAVGVSPKVVQEIVVNVDGTTRLTVEDKTPAVGQKHFTVLVSRSKEPGGWKIPPVAECTQANGTANLAGAASIISKLSYCLTDDQNPHSYAILHDARCLHVLVKRNARYPSFFISPAISLDNPHLFHVLTHLFLWDPPSSLEDGYDPPAETPLLNSTELPPHPPDSKDGFVGIATVLHRCKNRPHKSTSLNITHSTEKIDSILITSFDDAPSRATVMRGLLGSRPIVIKLADQDRDSDIKTEGAIYRNRLQGIDGVPKFYAEGWIYANHFWVYCLVLEDLGVPLTQEGIQSTEEIDAESWRQLEDLQARLLERGVVHDDLEPRNIIRTRSGGIGLVDFEGAILVPAQINRQVKEDGGDSEFGAQDVHP